MPSLAQRFRDWRGPSRGALQAQIADLQSNRFKRFNPVPSGVPITYNQFQYEQTEALTGAGRWDQLDRLALDPHVKGALRGITLPLVNADWEIEPADDTPRSEEIAEFVSANLLRKGGDKYGSEFYLQTAWKATRLREILDMLESGFSMFAKSTRIVNGKRVYDRLQWLEPSSVDPRGWVLNDQDEIQEVKRTYSTPEHKYKFFEPIPAEQLLLYAWDVKGARFEGRPLTRPMFGAWMRKEFKQKMSAILAQKLGAPVPYGFYPKGFPPDAIPAFKQYIESLRGTAAAEAFFVGPMSDDGKPPEVGFAGAEHNIDRGFIDSINSENQEIGHAGGSTSSNLGETESGSRALGDSKGMSEMVLVEAVAAIVSELETHGMGNLPGAIEELVDWNFSGVKDYPRLVSNKINQFAISKAFEQTVEAWNAGIIPKTPEARRQITETNLGLNLNDDAYEVEEPLPILPNPLEPSRSIPEASSPDDQKGVGGNPPPKQMGLESVDEFRARIAPMLQPVEDAPAGGKFRARTRLEVEIVNLAAVQQSFRIGERDILTELRAAHRNMIADLLTRLRAGKVTIRNIEGQRRSAFKGARGARARIKRALQRVGGDGMQHVLDELERQEGV